MSEVTLFLVLWLVSGFIFNLIIFWIEGDEVILANFLVMSLVAAITGPIIFLIYLIWRNSDVVIWKGRAHD